MNPLDETDDRLKQRDKDLDERAKEVDRLIADEKDTLFRITGMNADEARQVLQIARQTLEAGKMDAQPAEQYET